MCIKNDEKRRVKMKPVLYPLIILNTLQLHSSKENPLSISEMTHLINLEYAPFADGEHVINRSTVNRTLESLVNYTEVGNLFQFRVIVQGTKKKKKYYIINQ